MASSSDAMPDHGSPATSGNKNLLSPKKFPDTGFQELDPSIEIEEETLPCYHPTLFYPVQIGDVLQDRYQVITKFGYGSTSTAWLCKDLNEIRYVVLKVYIYDERIENNPELECFRHFQSGIIDENHSGRHCIRLPEKYFTLVGERGSHDVFVLRPLSLSVRALQNYTPDGVFPEHLAVSMAQAILTGLEFLHLRAKVIHCDVHSGNILLKFIDDTVISRFEAWELTEPTARKLAKDGRVIHTTQQLCNAGPHPILCDFSGARICVDDEPQRGLPLMPEHYRPPEVILDMPWSYPVDMWCLGLSVWRMLSAESMFNYYNFHELDEAHHLAMMVAILGPPPLKFLQKSEKSLKYWDADGNWKGIVPLLPDTYTLEAICPKSFEGEARDQYLDFIRKMLHWDPEERLYAGAAWNHPWVHRAWGDNGFVLLED